MARRFRRTCRPTVCAWQSAYCAPAQRAAARVAAPFAKRPRDWRARASRGGVSQVDQLLLLLLSPGWSSFASRLTSTAVTRVYQLASETRVPPQLPNPAKLGGVAFRPG